MPCAGSPHLVGFMLQGLSWWWFRDFVPQQRQYEAVLAQCHPDTLAKWHPAPFSAPTVPPGLVSGPVGPPAMAGVGSRWALVLSLQHPRFFSVFAVLELVTVIYVWAELVFPTAYCSGARPLSLYCFPILMCLLDLSKLNVFLASRFSRRGQRARGLLALLDAGIAITHRWTTTALAALCISGMATDARDWCWGLCGSSPGSEDTGADDEADTTANPIHSEDGGDLDPAASTEL